MCYYSTIAEATDYSDPNLYSDHVLLLFSALTCRGCSGFMVEGVKEMGVSENRGP